MPLIDRFELHGMHPETGEPQCFGSIQFSREMLEDTNDRVECFNLMLQFALHRTFTDGSEPTGLNYVLASTYDASTQTYVYTHSSESSVS